MDKRVYGVIGISSKMANWNADFSGYPKTTLDGSVFGSDKALKYPMKKMWDNQGEKVLYIKSLKIHTEKDNTMIIPKTLGERYEEIFGEPVPKEKQVKGDKVLKNLLSAIDVMNFGATFAEAGNNIGITGAVQFGQGYNKYGNHEAFEQPILSPFRDPNAKDKSKSNENKEGSEARNSTLGTKILSDEAHYFYSFSINPLAYKEFIQMGVTEGYTESDYEKFKLAAITSATAFSTNSKAGCENEFALFVETENDLYLPNLADYITFEKGEDKDVIAVNCSEVINEVSDRIKSVEIYYNPYTIEVKHSIDNTKMYNILTQKEV